jgi:hypothetical protein
MKVKTFHLTQRQILEYTINIYNKKNEFALIKY